MAGRVARVAGALIAVVVGGLLAFMTTGPALFADGAFRERVVALGIGVAAFAVLGAAMGAISPHRWKSLAVLAWIPGVAVATALSLDAATQPILLVLAVAFVIGDLAAVLGGAWAAASWRARRG